MTIDLVEGFLHGQPPTTTSVPGWNDSAGTAGGVPTVTAGEGRYGDYALRINASGAGNSYVQWTRVQNDLVGRVWVRYPSLPGAERDILSATSTSGSISVRIKISSNDKLAVKIGAAATVELAGQFVADQWHMIDFKFVLNSTTWSVDTQFDQVAQTQVTQGGQTSTTTANLRIGTISAEASDRYYDGIVLASVGHTYPISSLLTRISKLVPVSDGTHNGSTMVEFNGGTDIGSATDVWQRLDTIPPNNTTYIQMSAAGASNYAEVVLGTDPDGYTILAAQASLHGDSSSSTNTNDIECRISDDSFSTFDTIWNGDWSEGTGGSNFIVKKVMLSNAFNSTLASLKARWGFSSDAAPLPRAELIIVQYLQEEPAGTTTPQAVDATVTGTVAVTRSTLKSILDVLRLGVDDLISTTVSWVTGSGGGYVAASFRSATPGTPISEGKRGHANSNGAGTIAVTWDEGGTATTGRVLVALCTPTQSADTSFTASGWTNKGSGRGAILTKISDGTETGITITLGAAGNHECALFELIGAHTTNGWDREGRTTIAGSSTSALLKLLNLIFNDPDEWVGFVLGLNTSNSGIVWDNSVTQYYQTARASTASRLVKTGSAGVVLSVLKLIAVALTATLSITRSILKSISMAVTDTLAVTRSTQKPQALSTTLTPVVTRIMAYGKIVTATVTVTVSVSRSMLKAVAYAAALTPVVSRIASFLRTIPVSLTATASAVRAITKGVIALALTATAFVTRSTQKPVARTITSTPAVTRSTLKPQARTITLTPAVTRTAGKLAALAATMTSLVTRSTQKAVSRAITATVAVTRSIVRLVALTLTATPVVSRITNKLVSYGAAATVVVSRIASFLRTVPISLSASPSVTRITNKLVSIGVTLTAVVTNIKAFLKIVALNISLAPAVTRSTQKLVAYGSAYFLDVVKRVNKLVALSATAAPTVVRRTNKLVIQAITAGLNVVGDYIHGGGSFPQLVSASVTATVSVTRSTQKLVSRAITAAMAVFRGSTHTTAVSVTATPTVTRRTLKQVALGLVDTLSVLGDLIEGSQSFQQAVQVMSTMVTAITRRTNKRENVPLTAATSIVRQTSKTIARDIVTAVNVRRTTAKAVDLTMDAAATVGAHLVMVFVQAVSVGVSFAVALKTKFHKFRKNWIQGEGDEWPVNPGSDWNHVPGDPWDDENGPGWDQTHGDDW